MSIQPSDSSAIPPSANANISLIGLEFYAYHGVHPEERVLGGKYLLDIIVGYDIGLAGETDDVTATANYQELYRMAKEAMATPVNLIERIAYNLAHTIKQTIPEVLTVTIRVKKLAPPIGGIAEMACVEITL
jgi:7,8-dihydroneopterin aldolase/epimerase/oxygenase